MQDRGIKLFRTDLQGTVVAYSDGSSIRFNTEPTQDWTPGIVMKTGSDAEAAVAAAAATAGAAALAGSDPDSAQQETENSSGLTYVCNTNTKKFHEPYCNSVDQIKEENKLETTKDRKELIAEGYSPCGNCNP